MTQQLSQHTFENLSMEGPEVDASTGSSSGFGTTRALQGWEIDLSELDSGYDVMLGEGSIGDVYKAKLRSNAVAVKILKKDFETEKQHKQALKDFDQELSVVSEMTGHPNIIKFVGGCVAYIEEDNSALPILVYECMLGGSLDQVFKKERSLHGPAWTPAADLSLSWCHQLAVGLDYLHTCRMPVAHRDIKIDNLLVSHDLKTLKLADFSLSLPLTRQHDHDINDGAGTLRYMSPEVARYWISKSEDLVKADVFSAGVTMWCMLHGSIPFPEIDEAREASRALRHGIRPRFAKDKWGMKEIIHSAWHQDPFFRPSAAELACQTEAALSKHARSPWRALKSIVATKAPEGIASRLGFDRNRRASM